MDRLAELLATWFGCGYSPVAPGTVGTLGALPLYCVLRPRGRGAVLAGALVATAVGVWASGRVAEREGVADPQIVVIDEVAGVLLALAFAPRSRAGVVAAVALFRALDIAKPWPIRELEALPGGWGVMMDDIAAGALAAGGVVALEWLGAVRA
ncbi:MAG: phosphatidylglycerophosphatase A [Polyangiaceae bacterium]